MNAPDDRRVWVAHVERDPYVGDLFVLIEQFGDAPPAVAIRRATSQIWGPPYLSKEGYR